MPENPGGSSVKALSRFLEEEREKEVKVRTQLLPLLEQFDEDIPLANSEIMEITLLHTNLQRRLITYPYKDMEDALEDLKALEKIRKLWNSLKIEKGDS